MAEERCESDCFSLHRGRHLPLAPVPAYESGQEEHLGLYSRGIGCWTGVRGSFWKASRGRLTSRSRILDHHERESGRRNTRRLRNATFRKERSMQRTTRLLDPTNRKTTSPTQLGSLRTTGGTIIRYD